MGEGRDFQLDVGVVDWEPLAQLVQGDVAVVAMGDGESAVHSVE